MDKKVLWFGRDEIKYPITCGIESGRYVFRDADENEIAWLFELNTVVKIANELSQLRAERDALKARVEELEKLSNELEQKLFDAEDSAEFEIGEAAKLLQLASFNTNYAKDDATEWIQRNFGNTQHNTTPGGDE